MARGKRALDAAAEPVEGPWGLPDGWHWTRLADVTAEPLRGDPVKRYPSTFRYLDVSGIDGAQIEPKVLKVDEAPSRARQFVEVGDTVLSSVRVYLRNVVLINRNSVDVASTAFCVLRPQPGVDPNYLFLWVGSDAFINGLLPLQRGNSPPAVLDGDIRAQAIPLPENIERQKAIVTRVNSFFAEIEEGETALADARSGVETYRKALLKAAVTGELTADWRRDNPAKETGQNLLRRILSDRRARWEADPKNRNRRYPEPVAPEVDHLPVLPEGWTWASLDQLATEGPTNGYSPKASRDGSGTKALKLTATSGGGMRLDPDCVKTLSETIDPRSGLFLEPGDLLFQRGNTSELVGIAGVFDGPRLTYIYPDLMIRVRTPTPALTAWVWRWANSPHGRDYLMSRAQGAAGSMPKISGQTLRSMPVPVAPEGEIREGLNLIDVGLAKIGEYASQVGGGDIAILRQSILLAAFRGELT